MDDQFLYRCGDYKGKIRCKNMASGKLYDEEGNPVPGCWVCKEHGEEIIKEYQEKLGILWTIK